MLGRLLRTVANCPLTMLRSPKSSVRDLSTLPERVRGMEVARHWDQMNDAIRSAAGSAAPHDDPANPLQAYFDGVSEGPGIWKWRHYFEIYHRHLAKFIGRPVNIVEIGVYSGGSMPMWRHYFGPQCRVYGVDIAPECKVYENDHTEIHIGDQADRQFWKRFRTAVPKVDILIDDGGHLPHQQIATLEEMLPHLQPGGVFVCEDIHGIRNAFAKYVHSLADDLNAFVPTTETGLRSRATPFQAAMHSIHSYPYMTVIEKREAPLAELHAPKHGTEWQPFYAIGQKHAAAN